MQDRFDKRKSDVLSKLDKSHIGNWDEKIKKLCEKINSLENYYTTSSCSGRAVLMIEQEKKAEGLFVAVYHDKITLEKLKEDLKKIISSPTTITPTNSQLHLHSPDLNSVKLLAHLQNAKIKFKLEPCILHVSCRSLEDAQRIYDKAKLSGWKKSGIIGTKNGFTVELNGTDRLEFPVIRGNKILVDDEFLKIIVEECNEKMEKSWEKIKRLEKEMK